jgi:hypothetical protein
VLFGTAAALAALILIAGTTIEAKGFPGRFDRDVEKILTYHAFNPRDMFREGTCFLRPGQDASEFDVKECMPGKHPSVIFWGSSRMAQYYWGMKPLLEKRGFALGQMTASICAPLIGFFAKDNPKCKEFNYLALNMILNYKPEMVVMSGEELSDEIYMNMLEPSIAKMNEIGIKVIVLGPGPYYKRAVPLILVDHIKNGNRDEWLSDSMVRDTTFPSDAAMAAHFARSRSAKYVSVLEAACPHKECPLEMHGIPLHTLSA